MRLTMTQGLWGCELQSDSVCGLLSIHGHDGVVGSQWFLPQKIRFVPRGWNRMDVSGHVLH